MKNSLNLKALDKLTNAQLAEIYNEKSVPTLKTVLSHLGRREVKQVKEVKEKK